MPGGLERPVLCVDIGGTSTKVCALDTNGEVRFVESIASKAEVDSYFNHLVRLIEQIRSSANAEFELPPIELGISVAGFLDPTRDYLAYNPNLPWLTNFPLRQRLAERFPELVIQLEIDSNAATMAEYKFGSGKRTERFLCVIAGTGLGVGMAVKGEPLRFAHGCMGDIGHVIVQRDGPLCPCGGRGCAEVMVSAPVLAERYRVAAGLPETLTLRDVIEAAETGNQPATRVLREAGEWLGIAIASMANILFPDHIAIAGGLSAGGDFVLKPAQRTFFETACVLARSRTTFTKAALGSSASLVGAAWPFWR
jgi:glucokinase